MTVCDGVDVLLLHHASDLPDSRIVLQKILRLRRCDAKRW